MMTCACDQCGKSEPARFNGSQWHHPDGWYSRVPNDEKTELHCCSRDCIAKLSAKTGKVAVVGFL
jgi:hypothetical protein